MGELHVFIGAPIRRLLKVENLIGCFVARRDVLVIGVCHCPWLAADALTFVIEHVPFRDTSIFAVVMGIQGFDAHVTSRYGLVKPDFLPTVARGKLTGLARRFAGQIQSLSFLAVRIRRIDVQFVDDRFGQTFDHGFLRTYNVLYDNLVLALLQPASGHV